MAVHSIDPGALTNAMGGGPRDAQLRAWCAALEAGSVLYFGATPVPVPPEDIDFLLGLHQAESRLHKNISYKPDVDVLGGIDKGSTRPAILEEVHAVMRRYSSSVTRFLGEFLAPYEKRWRVDYASYRPIEEKGRELPVRRRNDLLHVDAFPTRPTKGWRILRFFHNIHPERTRDWVVGQPFGQIVGKFTPRRLAIPAPSTGVARAARQVATASGLGRLVPQWKRTPYDEFMMRLHNAMKEDAEFQRTCDRDYVQFAAGSSWMVFTDTVPHAALAGRYALEQTLIVDPSAMVMPESSPIAVLEKMAGARLV